MTHSFNLIDQPWIPCITTNGEFVEVSLYKLFTEAQYLREICCETPIMTASIFPLALAILHRVFGPEDVEAWEALWTQGAFPIEPLESYFNQWYDRFDLFHPERPFYQMKDDRGNEKSVLYLAEAIANTHTLFTHATEETTTALSPSQVARTLLVAQAFRLGGGNSGKNTPNFVDSIFAKGVLFFAQGTNLFESLMFNLIAYPDESYMLSQQNDKPFWEKDNPIEGRRVGQKMLHLIPLGYLDYLTWQTNHVWLVPETTAEGTSVARIVLIPVAKLADEVHSPQKRYIKREKKGEITWSFLYFNTDRALWRDFHSLLALDQEDIKPPAVIQWLARLKRHGILSPTQPVKLMAIGRLADQAKPIFYRQEIMPLPLNLLNSKQGIVEQAIQHAEATAEKLRYAIRLLAENVLMRGGDRQPDSGDRDKLIQQWDALATYWEALESSFWQFIADLSSGVENAPDQWITTLCSTAKNALNKAAQMAGESPSALKGSVIAQRALDGGLKKLFNSVGEIR